MERGSETSRYHGVKFLDHNNRELKQRRWRRQQKRRKIVDLVTKQQL